MQRVKKKEEDAPPARPRGPDIPMGLNGRAGKLFSGSILKTLDALCVLTCWSLSYIVRFRIAPGGQEGLEFLFLKLAPLLTFITLWFFHKNGLYGSRRFHRGHMEILSVFKANTFAVLTFVIVLYFFAEERLSRATLIMHFFFSTFFLTVLRITVKNHLRSMRRKGKYLRRILLVGNGPQLREYVQRVRHFKDSGIYFVGCIDGGEGLDVDLLEGNYQDIVSKTRPDTVVIGYGASEGHQLEQFLRKNYNDLIPLQILPDLSFSLIGHRIEDFAGIPLLSVNQPTYGFIDLFCKRCVDIVISLVGMILIAPLLLLIAVGIKFSSKGPPLYGQRRIGVDGEEFTMWKFRTMEVAKNREDENSWSSKDNPRKTVFGNFLRRTSLDELPQLWNVLLGQMSLVGPRPERSHFVDKFRREIPHYMLRHKTKSGMTGLAQINGFRGDTSIAKRVEYDIYYIKNRTLWLDSKILFLTFWKGFISKNAY